MTPRSFVRAIVVCLMGLGLGFTAAGQQPSEQIYSRLNTFSGFVEYSNDSTHVILGQAMNRKIGAIGFQYQRRLVHRRSLDFFYQAEVRPAMLESDPVQSDTFHQISPIPVTVSGGPGVAVERCYAFTTPNQTVSYMGVTYVYNDQFTCGRRTVVAQGFAPGGIRVNLMPRRRTQLTFSSNAGYIFSSQEVPTPGSGSFNFCFDFGGGIEFYGTHGRSARIEYQVQHFSNKSTADLNPGVDSGFIRLTYAFGR